MNPRHITLAAGTAVGGLLIAAFLPMAIALADDNFVFEPDPNEQEIVLDAGGSPPFYDDVGGTKLWDVVDTSKVTPTGAPDVVGSFETVQDHWTTSLGISNLQLFVTSLGGGGITQTGEDEPTVNSVFDWTYFGSGNDFYNFYSDIAGTGGAGNIITDTLVTPFGDFNIPIDFDASELFSSG